MNVPLTLRRGRPPKPVDPEQVITLARDWLGTPYHDQACLKGVDGDCLGLARRVRRELHGPEPFPIPPYSRDWGETGEREVLAEGAARLMLHIAVEARQPRDLLLFRKRPGAIAEHVGILTAPDQVLHAYERLGVIEEPLTPAWARRIGFVFRFPQPRRSAARRTRNSLD